MAKKIFTNESLKALIEEIKVYVANAISSKANTNHNHDSIYDSKGSANTALANAKTYTDQQVATKTVVQFVTWGADD